MRWVFAWLLLTSCTFSAAGGGGAGSDDGDGDGDGDDSDAAAVDCHANGDYADVGPVGSYRFIGDGLTRAEAEMMCAADGARLASPFSVAQVNALAGELTSRDLATPDCFLGGPRTPCGHIGLHQSDTANTTFELWQRSDGTQFPAGDPSWSTNQPDDDDFVEDGFENCAIIYTGAPAGIDDRPCGDNLRYPAICQCP